MRKLRLLLPLALLCVLLSAASASASDLRANDSADRLFYGTPVTVDVATFGIDATEPGTAGGTPTTLTCTRPAGPAAVTVGKTAWYRIVGTGGAVDLSTLGSTNGAIAMDSVLAVYPLGSDTPAACSDDTQITPLDFTSRIVSFATTANQVYEVQVSRFGAGACTPDCTVHLAVTNAQSPPGDQRALATTITSSATPNNTFASEEPNELLVCPDQGVSHLNRPFAKTVWLKYVAPADGTATFRAGGAVDTVEAVYAGASTTFLACNDDDGSGAFTSRVDVPVTAGATYFAQIGGFNGAFGGFAAFVDFTATPAAPPPPPPPPPPSAPAPNQDADGDGFVSAQFGGPDCNDASAAVHPGAADTTPDGIDQNCDGHDAAATPVLKPAISLGGVFTKTSKLTRLAVSGAPVGAKVVLTCSSRKLGCGSFTSKSVTVASAKPVQLGTFVKKLKLKKNAKLTVSVTKAGSIGAYVSFTVRSRKSPLRRALCLPPGTATPQACG